MDRDVRRFVFDALRSLRSGCFPVVMNPRGCAGSPLTTARGLSWPGLPSSSEGVLALFNAYGNMLLLALCMADCNWDCCSGRTTVQVTACRGSSCRSRILPSHPNLWSRIFPNSEITEGNLSAPIGMRAGIITANFILQTVGFLTYWPSTPLWLANTHPWHPFQGAVGLGSCAILCRPRFLCNIGHLFLSKATSKKGNVRGCTGIEMEPYRII